MISYTVALKLMVYLKSEKSAHYFYWIKLAIMYLIFIFKNPFFNVHSLVSLHLHPRNIITGSKMQI